MSKRKPLSKLIEKVYSWDEFWANLQKAKVCQYCKTEYAENDISKRCPQCDGPRTDHLTGKEYE